MLGFGSWFGDSSPLIFLAALLVYGLTLCPTVYVGDSGELVAAAHHLGVAHPTGYPLYLLLTKAFASLVPFGSIAWRANLFSAVCAGLSAEILARSVRRLAPSSPAWWIAGLSAVVLGPLWTQATVARVYPLSTVFTALLLYCLVRWWRDGATRWWFWHHGLLGLGLANHTMLIAHLPVFVLVTLAKRPGQWRNVRLVVLSSLCVLPGLSFYSYVPLRAASNPAVEYRVQVREENGSRFESATTLPVLRSYFSRELHHSRRWMESAADYVPIFQHHLKSVAKELSVPGLLLAMLGIFGLTRCRAAALAGACVLLWVANVALLGWHGAWWDIFLYPRYLSAGWMALLFLLGVGMSEFAVLVREKWKLPRAAVLFLLGLPLLWAARNYQFCDRSDHTLAEDYARALLQEIPENGQLFATADSSLYPIWYLQAVEGVRDDLEIVNPLHFSQKLDLVGQVDPALSGQWQGKVPRDFYSCDPRPTTPMPYYPRQQVGLLTRICSPQRALPPLPPLEVPEIFGLEDSSGLDTFSVSMVALIHANLAAAHFARGEEVAARDRLRRVANLDAGRGWGYWAGTELCLRMGQVDLARELLSKAHEFGNPREPATAALGKQVDQLERGLASLERAHLASDLQERLVELKKAARQAKRYFPALEAYAEALLEAGRAREVVALMDEATQRDPGEPRFASLRARAVRAAGQ